MWVDELSVHRREKHTAWVEGISAIQSNLNRAYRIPYRLNELHQDFFDKYGRVPQSQVYIQNLPDMQEKELLDTVLTWFGMAWIGNPFIIERSIPRIYEQPRRNPNRNDGCYICFGGTG